MLLGILKSRAGKHELEEVDTVEVVFLDVVDVDEVVFVVTPLFGQVERRRLCLVALCDFGMMSALAESAQRVAKRPRKMANTVAFIAR